MTTTIAVILSLIAAVLVGMLSGMFEVHPLIAGVLAVLFSVLIFALV